MLRLALDVLDRILQPRARADEIADVRRRLVAAQAAARHASASERRRARELSALRQKMIDALDQPRACARCERPCEVPSARRGRGNGYQRTRGYRRQDRAADGPFSRDAPTSASSPWKRQVPHGFSGGACCAAKTSGVFSDDELYVLALAGAQPGDYRAAPGPHAGCAFRDARGCTLAVHSRPTICLRYLCHELQSELQAHGRRHDARAIARDLRCGFEALVAEQRERSIDALLDDAP